MATHLNKNTCSRCNQMGHWSRNCPAPRPPCFKCNQSGHWARDCPKNGQTDAEQSAIQKKLDEMQKRLDENDRRYEAKLRQQFEKEKKEFDDDSFDEGPLGRFETWEEYRTGHRGGVWAGFENTYTDEIKQNLQKEAEERLEKEIKEKQEELRKLKEKGKALH